MRYHEYQWEKSTGQRLLDLKKRNSVFFHWKSFVEESNTSASENYPPEMARAVHRAFAMHASTDMATTTAGKNGENAEPEDLSDCPL